MQNGELENIKMSKFIKATKRIMAVGSSMMLMGSSVFAAYPQDFISNGRFNGQIVVGSEADIVAAQSIIDDLRSRLSGEGPEQVEIIYEERSSGSTPGANVVSAIDEDDSLIYGSSLGSTNGIVYDSDYADSTREDNRIIQNIFEDSEVDNNEYTQQLEIMENVGMLDYKIFTDMEGDREEEARTGLSFEEGVYATYTLEFNDPLDLDDVDDIIGEEITIMGKEFTIVEIDNTDLSIVGGSNEIDLEYSIENRNNIIPRTYAVEGIEKDVELAIVVMDEDEVLLEVNGKRQKIRENGVEEIDDITVALTRINYVESSGYGIAQFIIGGQKIEFKNNNIRINDEDFTDTDIGDDYDVEIDWDTLDDDNDDTFNGFNIVYSLNDDMNLNDGDEIMDPLFKAFSIVYDGLNPVSYSQFEIDSSTGDTVTFSGNLRDGESIPRVFMLSANDDDSTTRDFYLGDNSQRIWFGASEMRIVEYDDGDSFFDDSFNNTNGSELSFNFTGTDNNVQDVWIFSSDDTEDGVYLYDITNYDRGDRDETNDEEFSVKGYIDARDKSNIDLDEVDNALAGIPGTAITENQDIGTFDLDLANLEANYKLFLENGLTLDFENIENEDVSTDTSYVTFGYYDDIVAKDDDVEDNTFRVDIKDASDGDEIHLSIHTETDGEHDFVNSGGSGTNDEDDDPENKVYVDAYGTKVTVNTDDDDRITIMVPDEEVTANVLLRFGSSSGSSSSSKTMSVIVNSDMADDKVSELEAEGHRIISRNPIERLTATFDVEGHVFDTQIPAGSNNLIVVGGPAVNSVARELLGVGNYFDPETQAGVSPGEGISRYYRERNSVLVYGWSAEDTRAAVEELNSRGGYQQQA